ncbi:FeoA family protein [Pectinatus frisingensis]|jgi:ferrous iron transport protein A|uniref:FeoA family protein n=1 Tax=Pectinatus frisingensis TaxID=865 RepID=UPI0015F68B93|nr:FeoA family protein [Pectinatus frisingensis]
MAIVVDKNRLTLNRVHPGSSVKIEYLEQSPLKERLMSMGLVPGTVIKVLRSAPLGDPMAISVRSYNLSLRLNDAEKIIVAPKV